MTTRLAELRTERGDMNIEAVIGISALIALLGLGLLGMRVETAQSAIDAAARAAARQASLAHDGRAAASAAEQQSRAVLAEQSITCAHLTVGIDASEFGRPAGINGTVTARIRCDVPLADLLPGLTGTRPVEATFRSPIDRYGARR
ncbi:hypothetical protein L3Q65_18055 [Amycolatopsis sp. FU40]|uniref:hypothetical protein n=1 Tax=Amycolatopsis sp. FU40 TaxID=2914159 RepID=UPI001F2689C5|nr:hypothetical protein [Amycolatopsis sp. FU40]UKD58542.1 hypothetical protein L3Q65_18055 [Amycolatopsis sp. FU40]